MSYTTADKIVSTYSALLMNVDSLDLYKKYSYSDLQGYDIIDVSNALKLMIAYRVFINNDINETKIEELKKYTEAGAVALISFLDLFYPDQVVLELNKIDPNDKMAIVKSINIKKDSLAEIESQFRKEETPDSFLEYCLNVGKLDPDYWELIYKRIGITWETNDEYDRIYINIALKYGNVNSNKKSKEINKSKSSSSILGYLKNLLRQQNK